MMNKPLDGLAKMQADIILEAAEMAGDIAAYEIQVRDLKNQVKQLEKKLDDRKYVMREQEHELAKMHEELETALCVIDAFEGIEAERDEYKAIADKLIEIGYPHNFQLEKFWIKDFCYAVSRVIKQCFELRERETNEQAR